MAKIDRMLVGESLVGDGNEVAHIDLILGPRGSAAETAFATALTNNKDGFTSLLAVVAPNLLCKPATVMFNKVTIKGAKQAVQMFGPAQRGVAMAVADSGVPYLRIDPTKVDVGSVGGLVSQAYAQRHRILPVEVHDDRVVIATSEPNALDWLADHPPEKAADALYYRERLQVIRERHGAA